MVACAAATCPKGTISQYDAIFYVCQYTPAGNVQGEVRLSSTERLFLSYEKKNIN